MAERTNQLLKRLKETRCPDAATLHFLRSHLILKGINPEGYPESSPDDPAVVAELEKMLGKGAVAAPATKARA
jgi:hypothetical protein